MRPTDQFIFLTDDLIIADDPIIPARIYAVSIDTGQRKLGNGVDKWSDLPNDSSPMIGNKTIQTSREPSNNEILIFCNTEDKWIFRLFACHYTQTECISMASTVMEKWTHVIEVDDSTSVPTGRFKICDGTTQFGYIPWFGETLVLSDFEIGESIEFDGTGFIPAHYLKINELQSSDTPVGKFHKDDGTWAYLTNLIGIEEVEAESGKFEVVIIGVGDTEPVTISLTSDGTDLFVDGNKVWTAYNDGDGSGLDADTLDGRHYTSFATTGDVSTADENALIYAIVMGG